MVKPLLLTISSALLYAASFPPLSWYPLMWVSLVPFFLATTRVRPVFAALCGVLWGLVIACGLAWWLPGMLVNYFRFSTAVGWLGFLAVGVGLCGIYYGAFAAWLSWLAGRQAASPLLVAAGWGVCEFARANLLIGNPWALSAYSQMACTHLIQIADATGPYGIGMLIAAVNMCLAGFFIHVVYNRRVVLSYAGVAVALSATLGYGQWRLSQTFVTGEPVTVAVIQGAVEPQIRRNLEHRKALLQRYLDLTNQAAAARPNIIFWPEYALDFSLQNAPERGAVLDITRTLGADLILGSPYSSYSSAAVHYYNSVFLLQGGKFASRYDKLVLLPFAEENRLPWLFHAKRPLYTPGRDLQVLPAHAAQIGALICVEAMYPEMARRFALQGAQILANPSNDDWFNSVAALQQQLNIVSLRAVENRRYMVRPTASGFSAIVDPYGRIVARSGFGAPEVLVASIYPSSAQTLYHYWGDAAAWSALASVVLASLWQIYWQDLY